MKNFNFLFWNPLLRKLKQEAAIFLPWHCFSLRMLRTYNTNLYFSAMRTVFKNWKRISTRRRCRNRHGKICRRFWSRPNKNLAPKRREYCFHKSERKMYYKWKHKCENFKAISRWLEIGLRTYLFFLGRRMKIFTTHVRTAPQGYRGCERKLILQSRGLTCNEKGKNS